MYARAMHGINVASSSLNNSSYTVSPASKIIQQDSKAILKDLLAIVKECQTRYGGKTELATENDSSIANLCIIWEVAFSHGLKSSQSSVLKSVTDLVSGSFTEPPTYWEFVFPLLTAHEKERFSTLRHVWTERGKGRALIRAALNERALERYILMWLNEPSLKSCFEQGALLRDDEATNLLPSIAAGLGSILFAMTVDGPEMNVTPRQIDTRPEPIIVAPHPVSRSAQSTQHKVTASAKRQIISFDDDEPSVSSASSASDSFVPPKSLSSMCLKFDEQAKTSTRQQDQASVHNKPHPSSANGTNDIYQLPESPSLIEIFNDTGVNKLPDDIMFFSTVDGDVQPDSMITPLTDNVLDHGASATVDRGSSSTSVSTSKDHSMHSSMSSVNNAVEDVSVLKQCLREAIDRCSMLEGRVAELSLENHRLKSQGNSSRHGFNYFSVSVPRVILQRLGGARNKAYYAYEVHIIPTHGGDEWTILRRYNDFYKLHKRFQKDNVAVKTLDFPPKKNFGNMDAHFVEQRRQRLQVYLRHLLAVLPDIAACTTRSQLEHVFPFFK